MNNQANIYQHIQASAPCSLRSVINWANVQGFAEGIGESLTELVWQNKIEILAENGSATVELKGE